MAVKDVSWEWFEERFWERTIASGSARTTTVGDLGKAHWIHAAVNNHQAEHQSTVLKTSGTVVDQTLSIMIDLCAPESFIYSAMLKRIRVKELNRVSLDL
jgi:hypothetical protein